MKIAVYGCDDAESALFHEMAPLHGILPATTDAPVSEWNLELAQGGRCISVGHKSRISAHLLRAIRGVGVTYISTRSVGSNHIDVSFARKLGIAVEGVAYSPDSVADYTVMLMLMALRHARSTVIRVEMHDYRLHESRGTELRDLTVGVVGTGRIGAAVVARLSGFGCRVLACDRCPRASAEYVDLAELLRESDVVTLHIPLTAQTHHLLDRRRLGQMRPGALVINTGRGSLIDAEALLAALQRGHLAGAALDVVEGEEGIFYADRRRQPFEDPVFLRLHQLPNVLITPHTAYYTDHALHDTVERSLMNCRRYERAAA
jgi:D-specific alpha-keto acid dehydrogenase